MAERTPDNFPGFANSQGAGESVSPAESSAAGAPLPLQDKWRIYEESHLQNLTRIVKNLKHYKNYE